MGQFSLLSMPEITTPTTAVARLGRVSGVDIARALALIGMVCAHSIMPEGFAGQLTYGFPSATFAFLAGISMSLMARRAVIAGDAEPGAEVGK